MSNKKERLNDAVKHLKDNGFIRIQRDIAERMGASEANVSNALKGVERNLTDKFITRFNESFDNKFNLLWLLTGEGPMLNTSDSSISQNGNGDGNVNQNNVNGDNHYNNTPAHNNKISEAQHCSETLELVQNIASSIEAKMKEHEEKNRDMKESMEKLIAMSVSMIENSEARMSEMMNRAVSLIESSMLMTKNMTEQNNSMRDLYTKLYEEQQGHVHRSREYLDRSQANIKELRTDLNDLLTKIEDKIDEQTKETTQLYINGRDEVINKCQTFIPRIAE